MTTENRWATPTILEVQWRLDGLPNYVDEDSIAATLAMPATNKDGVPAIAAIGCDPLDNVTSTHADAFPVRYWLVHALLVDIGESKRQDAVIATRISSVAMWEQGDTADNVRTEYLGRVVSFVADSLKAMEVADG
jgi:hypothetical protein